MTQEKVESFMIANAKYLPQDKVDEVEKRLLETDMVRWSFLAKQDFKDPSIMLICSILLGWAGVDRFMLKQIGMGILKLVATAVFVVLAFTQTADWDWVKYIAMAVCCVPMVIDWFTVSGRTRRLNLKKLTFGL